MTKSGNTDPRVDAYIAKAAPFAQPVLEHLRRLVHSEVPEAQETIKWRLPTFVVDGRIFCGMAAFKAHCAFMFWHKEMEAVLGPVAEAAPTAYGNLGRVTKVEDLPSKKRMRGYLRKAAELHASGVPARPREKKAPAAPPKVPSDLAAGMKKNRSAAATFAKLPPSGKRDYVEWITGAKRDETRRKRLATALEWLAEGKSRNWKYENC
jgi:uncharacterized protein YdeI (YjbR/CyaY-like superfamily)